MHNEQNLIIKQLFIEDIINIPDELISKNFIGGSKEKFIDSDIFKRRLYNFLDYPDCFLFGAFIENNNELICMMGCSLPYDIPICYITHARVFKTITGFPIFKNGWALLSEHILKLANSRNRWELYIRRGAEIERWGNRRYVNSFFSKTKIGSLYLRAIVDFIPSGKLSRWRIHNQIIRYEITNIDTILIKCWCPYEYRNIETIPEEYKIPKEIHEYFLNQKI